MRIHYKELWNDRERYKSVAQGYLNEPEKYTRLFSVTINGKLRQLVTYMPTDEGRQLRGLHTAYADFLRAKYRHASSSFAYAKGKNILRCVKKHLHGKTFFKTDIHAYFDSITSENLIRKMERMRFNKKDRNDFQIMTKACFYQDQLPLGFVSSPVISDYYLAAFDRIYQKKERVVYTRYADDFIVSSADPEAMSLLSDIREEMEADLEELDLELNRKKTYIRELREPGDAIHVLGVNIVRTGTDTNRITVSDSYIRKVSKAFCDWFASTGEEKEDQEVLAKLSGQIEFIRYCSKKSYAKLRKIIRIKSGYNGSLTYSSLRALAPCTDSTFSKEVSE